MKRGQWAAAALASALGLVACDAALGLGDYRDRDVVGSDGGGGPDGSGPGDGDAASADGSVPRDGDVTSDAGTMDAAAFEAGQIMWMSQIKGTGTMGLASTSAVDSKGNVFVGGGYYQSTLEIGATTLPVPTGEDGFLAKLDKDGAFVFAKAFGGPGGQGVAPAVDSHDSLFVTVGFETSTTIGSTVLTADPDGKGDSAVVSLDSSGNHAGHVMFGGPGTQNIDRILGLQKGVALCGENDGTAKAFVSGDVVAAGPGTDLVFAKLFTSGNDWAAQFSANGYCSSLSLDGAGELTVSGAYKSAVNFGGSTLPASQPATDFFVRFSSANAHQWSDLAAGPDGYITNSSSDGSNNIYGGGTFRNTWSLPPSDSVMGSPTIYQNVTFKLTPGGQTLWKKLAVNVSLTHYAVDSGGRLFVCGQLTGDTTFGTGNITHQGGGDALIVGYQPNGDVFYVKTFGDASLQTCQSITLDSAGNLVVSGLFEGTIATDGISVSSTGAYDGYVAKIKAP